MAVRSQAKRFNFLSAGRRWRKTTLAMSICVEAGARAKTILWGAPTFDVCRVGWEEVCKAVAGYAKLNQSRLVASFPSGGIIDFRSLDNPDNARGFTADGVISDESADVAETAWYGVLRPMLIDTAGWAWLIGTPKGQNWFWREFSLAKERDDSASWNAPTLGCAIDGNGQLTRRVHPLENPHIPFSEMLQLWRTMPERLFRQEILAEFIEESGGVFRGVRAAIDTGRSASEAPKAGARYRVGVDLARVEDFTVICVVEVATGRQVYHERFNQISWERQKAAINRVARLYNNAPVTLDSTGVGDPIFEDLRKSGISVAGFQFTNASKERLIDNLAIKIEQSQTRMMDIEAQTTELLAYRYELTPSRNVRMNAPEGLHDDCVIALALAHWSESTLSKMPGYDPLQFLASSSARLSR